MKFRKLRFSWSAACGILCLLLVALWVRSFSYSDELRWNITDHRTVWLHSTRGDASVFTMPFGDPLLADVPAIISERIDRPFPTEGFSFHRKGGGWNLTVPHWCPALILAALATVPWIQRFGLRTLLIGMALVTIALSLIVTQSR